VKTDNFLAILFFSSGFFGFFPVFFFKKKISNGFFKKNRLKIDYLQDNTMFTFEGVVL